LDKGLYTVESLYRFHQAEDGTPLTDQDDEQLSIRGKAQIRPEGPGLRALAVLLDLSVEAVRQLRQPTKATIDLDARIAEAHKKRALVAYDGTRGYQPQMAWWAELGVWLTDPFRDGNVPAEFEARAFLRQTFARLPVAITERFLRADSAFYNEDVVTNMGWNGERLLRWQREKQGTVEHGHGVVKNDLAGGVMPCGRFGSNAAWSRIQLLTHNLLVLLKTQALPSALGDARPKTLRFRLFNLPGRIVRHARGWVLELYEGLPFAADIVAARRPLLELARQQRAPGRVAAPP
jgi:hypothetical protein